MEGVPAELFTWSSLGTFTGLTGATVVVTNAVSRATNWGPAWFGLVVALVLCVGLAVAASAALAEYLLALLNACLVYVSSAGTSSLGAAATGAPKDDVLGGAGQPNGQFFRRWY